MLEQSGQPLSVWRGVRLRYFVSIKGLLESSIVSLQLQTDAVRAIRTADLTLEDGPATPSTILSEHQ